MKKSVSIILAVLLLFANIGFAKSSHFCMGEEMLSSFGITAEFLDCGMDDHSAIPSDHKGIKDNSNCCENQFEVIQTDVEQILKDFKFSSAELIFITAFTHSFILGKELLLTENSNFSSLNPPFFKQDFTVLFQSFLI